MDVKDGIGPLTGEDGNVISDNKDIWLKILTSISPQFLQTRIWKIFQNRDVCAATTLLKDVDLSYEAVLKKLE